MKRADNTIPKRLTQTETESLEATSLLSTLLSILLSILLSFLVTSVLTPREAKKLSRAAQTSLETLADSPSYNVSLSMSF